LTVAICVAQLCLGAFAANALCCARGIATVITFMPVAVVVGCASEHIGIATEVVDFDVIGRPV